MKRANDILKDLGFNAESSRTTQEAFVSRLIRVARDGSPSSEQELHLRNYESGKPTVKGYGPAKEVSSEKPDQAIESASQPKAPTSDLAFITELAKPTRKSPRSKTPKNENQLSFNFEAADDSTSKQNKF